jgi:hypothetical protein
MDDENELVELDFCCPECNCSQWYFIEDSLYTCGRCDYLLAIDSEEGEIEDLNYE